MTERKHFPPYDDAWKKFVRLWHEYFRSPQRAASTSVERSLVITDSELKEETYRDSLARLRETFIMGEEKKAYHG